MVQVYVRYVLLVPNSVYHCYSFIVIREISDQKYTYTLRLVHALKFKKKKKVRI